MNKTSPTVSAHVEESIVAAMRRLLDGKPELTDGTLTKANVYREAGVSRATLFRASHLLAWWDNEVGARSGKTPREYERDTENKLLLAEIAGLKKEATKHKRVISGARGIIAAQQIEIEELHEQIATGDASVITPIRRK